MIRYLLCLLNMSTGYFIFFQLSPLQTLRSQVRDSLIILKLTNFLAVKNGVPNFL